MKKTMENLDIDVIPEFNDTYVSLSWNMSYLNDTNGSEEAYIPYKLRPETYIVPAVFFVVFVVGFLGNGTLVLIVINNRSMRSIPNTYILSLAIGDFLVIVGSVPFISTIYTFDSWPYGIIICKLSEFLRDVSSGVTVLTLTLLSVDRYIAIVKPLHKMAGGGERAFTLTMAVSMWFISIILAIPGAYFSFLWEVTLKKGHTIYVCYPFPEEMLPWYPKTIVLMKFLLLYAVPLCFISAFYGLMARHLFSSSTNMLGTNETHQRKMETRAKVAKIVLVFIVIFVVCFFPTHVFLLWFYFYPNAPNYYSSFWHALKIIGYVLTFANSCLNPIALYFISSAFRNQYREYFFRVCVNVRQGKNRAVFETLPSTSLRSTMRTVNTTRI